MLNRTRAQAADLDPPLVCGSASRGAILASVLRQSQLVRGEKALYHPNGNSLTRLSALGIAAVLLVVLSGLGCAGGSAPSIDALEWVSRASRAFASLDRYRPEQFAAYGILAFQSKVTSSSRDRYLAICEGFVASLTSVSALMEKGVLLDQQMPTVWPLEKSYLADLNENFPARGPADRCTGIVDNIDIETSAKAISSAKSASKTVRLDGDGPYLLAWSPGKAFGTPGVPVLVADLSNVTTVKQAERHFVRWRSDIQLDSALWSNGWDLERVRTLIGLWADKYGTVVLSLLVTENF